MARFRRTAYAFLYCHDTGFLDVGLLLRGKAEPISLRQVLGLSALTGEALPLSRAELDTFLEIPEGEWSEAPPREEARWEALARKGLLVSDADEEKLSELRRRDEALASGHWHVLAALHHFLTRWRGEDVWRDLTDPELTTDEVVRGLGPPPPHFHTLGGDGVVPLPVPAREGMLYELLRRRRTTRGFDLERSLTSEELSVLLYWTFGCHGYTRLGEGLVGLRKTSPSGGALHPTEAYPLVRDVQGLDSGLYHYDVGRHALEPISSLRPAEAGELAVRLAAGQPYAGDAHALVVLTSRFRRSFWKYRRHDRAYAVLLMDAAHLSQTFHLVCAELGLGAFVTAAVNGADAEERLCLDGFSEGVLALCGCGRPAEGSPHDPHFEPYVPGETI